MTSTSVVAFLPEGTLWYRLAGMSGPGSVSLAPHWNFDGSVEAFVSKTCEVDIGGAVGTWTSP